MFFSELWVEVLVIGFAVFLFYMITAGFVMLSRRMRLGVILCRAFLLGSIAAAIAFALGTGRDVQNIKPLADLSRIAEIGYKAIWLRAAHDGLPFAIPGIMLPLAYRSCNRFSRGCVWAFAVALLLGVLRYAMGSFDVDELIFAFWGFIVGFSFTSLIAGLFPKARLFKIINFHTSAYVIGVLILMFTFFAGVAVLLLNNGADFVELKLPPQSRQLPEPKVSAYLSDETPKVETFRTVETDVMLDTARVAEKLGLKGEPTTSSEGKSYATVVDGAKSLTYFSAGNWNLIDDSAAGKAGTVPDDPSCARIVEQIAIGGVARNYNVFSTEVEPVLDDAGQLTSKVVTVTAAYANRRVVGSCEFIAEVGSGGLLLSLDKHDADFEPYKQVKVISNAEAMQLVKDGGVRADGKVITVNHNLYQDASAVEVTDATIAYWLEETKGYLQPIWLFSAKATLLDGGTKDFEIYVPAIKY